MRRLVDWFIDNRVAANLLMVFIIVGGALTLIGVKLEVFPDVNPHVINVSVVYPGALPEELEEGVCIKIEEVIEGLEGVKRITSTSAENVGTVTVELFQGTDIQKVLDDIKTRVDSISTFPEDAEKPVIVEVESPKVVASVAVSGKTDPITLKR
ncbi:MAG: efflux RND transporter permease subunit, partial [Planctomycetota bacterium]